MRLSLYDYPRRRHGLDASYFGHDDWARFAPGLKSIEDAIDMRRRILFAFEAAERESDPELRREWLTFVVVGGGPTGVELAGALAEIARMSLAKHFRNFNPDEGEDHPDRTTPRLLAAYPKELSEKARRSLERLGVDVRTGVSVTGINEKGVLAGSQWIDCRTVLWGAGVAASPLTRTLGVPLDRVGRVPVTPYLSVQGHDEVFVIGDLAAIAVDGKPVPGVASAALQEGRHAARNIARSVRGQSLVPFRYWDRGLFAVIGRGSAVGIVFEKFKASGFVAWLAWLGIHLVFLIGFRNRIAVLFNWSYSFFTLRRNAQLITGEDIKLLPHLSTCSERPRGPEKVVLSETLASRDGDAFSEHGHRVE